MSEMLATKPLDSLMREAGEEREGGLRRVLGPVNLVTLGIGAIIGAGIFVLTGTVAANFTGPAIILSFMLAGIGCVFAGLCYAEFASMIPIAGSAYTYTYATLGELVAWVIGWGLILEYAFSNISVSVGFAAQGVALLDWIGIPLSPKWLSPAYLPLGLQDLQGRDIYPAGFHAGFNIPAFLIVLLLPG